MRNLRFAFVGIILFCFVAGFSGHAATSTAVKKKKKAAVKSAVARKVPVENWKEPSFADSTMGDNIEGEDLVIRRAAVDALGPFNGRTH